MKLVIGSDHAAFALREEVRAWAVGQGYEVITVGAQSEEAYDYPDAADLAVQHVLGKAVDFGILLCGTGIGISIRANRHPGIRAANCCSPKMAQMAREHNYANILCLGARLLTYDESVAIVEQFLKATEDHAERHERRVEKMDLGLGTG